jgi:hypothetical protein
VFLQFKADHSTKSAGLAMPPNGLATG